MTAYLQVGLPKEIVEKTLRELSPIKIHLAPPEEDRRWIELDQPKEVRFEPGVGIVVKTTGRFKFDLAHIKIPAELKSVEFLLMPKIVRTPDEHQKAAIPIEILKSDLRYIPEVIDDWLMTQVNRAITPKASQLMWEFDEKLSAQFEIAKRLQPLESIALAVSDSVITVTEDELCFRINYEIDVERGS